MSDDDQLNMEPYKDMHPAVQEAWKRWFEADYSWEGLNDDLRTYWRTNPETGLQRKDEELIAEGELILGPSKRETYHLMHLPLLYLDGIRTNKNEYEEKLHEIILSRLNKSAPITINPNEDEHYYEIKAQFQGAVFLYLNLKNKEFNRTVYARYDGAIFTGLADFDGARLGYGTNNPDDSHNNFENAVFIKSAVFSNIIFHMGANFRGAQFFNGVNFKHASFEGGHEADFINTRFHRYITFNNTHFKNKANFKGTIFWGKLILSQAIFEQHADFSVETVEPGQEFTEAKRIPSIHANGTRARFYHIAS